MSKRKAFTTNTSTIASDESNLVSPKDAVQLLMTRTTNEPVVEEKASRGGGSSVASFHIYECKRCGETKRREVTAGYGNPYDHLKRCYGNKYNLNDVYQQAKRLQLTGSEESIVSLLRLKGATPRELAVIDWLRYVVEKSKPLSDVDDRFIRDFCKHNVVVSSKLVKEVIFALVDLVVDAIDKEMAEAPIGAIMHDGWSKVSTHYFGLFACYNRKKGKSLEPTVTLLAVSPLSKAVNDDDTDDETDEILETSDFDADTHA